MWNTTTISGITISLSSANYCPYWSMNTIGTRHYQRCPMRSLPRAARNSLYSLYILGRPLRHQQLHGPLLVRNGCAHRARRTKRRSTCLPFADRTCPLSHVDVPSLSASPFLPAPGMGSPANGGLCNTTAGSTACPAACQALISSFPLNCYSNGAYIRLLVHPSSPPSASSHERVCHGGRLVIFCP